MWSFRAFAAFSTAAAIVVFGASAFAAQTFENRAEGYALTPPAGWQPSGPGEFREMLFMRDADCGMIVFPAGRHVDLSPSDYLAQWEPKALKPGTNFERRSASQDVEIRGYPGIVAEYDGQSGPMEAVFLRLPHQILLFVLHCPGWDQAVIDAFGNAVNSVVATESGSAPTPAPEPPARAASPTPSTGQAPPSAPAKGGARPELFETAPQFVWE